MNTNNTHLILTDTSVRNIARFALPLMLQSVSGTIMLFCDRIILAQYSEFTMLAMISAGAICTTLSLGFFILTSITEVFVGQYYGSKQYQKIGASVWQMIWFCIPIALLFIGVGMFTKPILLQDQYLDVALPYYQICMSTGFLLPLLGALTGFFTGQGKIKIIVWNTIVGNLINLVLDIILIFGLLPGIEPMGIVGAAIATVISLLIQVLVLFTIFLNRQNQIHFKTLAYNFQPRLCLNSLKLSVPCAVAHTLEYFTWTYLIFLLGDISEEHLFVYTVGETIWILFAFATEGLNKTVIAIASNLIGANMFDKLKSLLFSTFTFYSCIMFIVAIPMLGMPDYLLDCFLIKTTTTIDAEGIYPQIQQGLFWAWVLLYLDGQMWILTGLLTAARDTKFIMITHVSSVILLYLLPFYFIVYIGNAEPYVTFLVSCFYGSANVLIYYIRYRYIDWSKAQLVSA